MSRSGPHRCELLESQGSDLLSEQLGVAVANQAAGSVVSKLDDGVGVVNFEATVVLNAEL